MHAYTEDDHRQALRAHCNMADAVQAPALLVCASLFSDKPKRLGGERSKHLALHSLDRGVHRDRQLRRARVCRWQHARAPFTRRTHHHGWPRQEPSLGRRERWARRPESNEVVLLLLGHIRHDLPKPLLHDNKSSVRWYNGAAGVSQGGRVWRRVMMTAVAAA
jgi:hypothetical protein